MKNLIIGLNKITITENLIIGLNKITITDSEETSDKDKLNIIELFRKNIKDKKIELEKYNNKHCGKEGYWLEKQMNIKHNSLNEPDIHGYEMKKDSKKITFGDFSASEYLFSKDKKYINDTNNWDADLVNITKDQFIKFFGTQKILKNNRYSWSGSCIPTYNNWNTCGQKLTVTYENDICILYSYSEDKRDDIKINFPYYLKKDNILIVIWKNKKICDNTQIDNDVTGLNVIIKLIKQNDDFKKLLIEQCKTLTEQNKILIEQNKIIIELSKNKG